MISGLEIRARRVIRSRSRESMVWPEYQIKVDHGQHVDDGDEESDQDAEPRHTGLTQGVHRYGHSYVGVEPIAAL
jgi:hypothetical protein